MLPPEPIIPPGREFTEGGLDRGCGPCEGGFEYGWLAPLKLREFGVLSGCGTVSGVSCLGIRLPAGPAFGGMFSN